MENSRSDKMRKPESLNTPEFDLEKGVKELAALVGEKLSHATQPIIVEIAGGSASGKTSAVAEKIKDAFGDKAIIFSMDDYYRGGEFMDNEAKKGNILNLDQPEALNLELLRSHLDALKAEKEIQKPVYNFKTGEPIGTETLRPCRVIIVEGLFALNDILAKEGDVKAFVDIGVHGRILRRLLRDVERTGQRPADILKYFSEVVEPMHEKYIQSTKKNADIVIKNEYSPAIEARRSGLHEIQLKFKADINAEKLRELGAEEIDRVVQTDYYYNPKDRNLIETDEILRIRDENDRKIFTYKGPRTESEFGKRPKFEFEIDGGTENKFLSIYGDKIKIIKKERILYRLNAITFSVDSVSKIENNQETYLGKFVEVRSTDKEADDKKIKETIIILGLSPADGIKQSYFEM